VKSSTRRRNALTAKSKQQHYLSLQQRRERVCVCTAELPRRMNTSREGEGRRGKDSMGEEEKGERQTNEIKILWRAREKRGCAGGKGKEKERGRRKERGRERKAHLKATLPSSTTATATTPPRPSLTSSSVQASPNPLRDRTDEIPRRSAKVDPLPNTVIRAELVVVVP
jgi:hypothetical protein